MQEIEELELAQKEIDEMVDSSKEARSSAGGSTVCELMVLHVVEEEQ